MLQFAPGYGYVYLALVSLGVVAVGMLVAYTFPSPFLKLLSFIATDFNQVELRGRNSERPPRQRLVSRQWNVQSDSVCDRFQRTSNVRFLAAMWPSRKAALGPKPSSSPDYDALQNSSLQ